MAEFSASDSEDEVYEVQEILESRKNGKITEYLVKWRNFDETHNSWEPQRNLSGAKDAIKAFLQAQKTPAKPESRLEQKVETSSRTGTGNTVTRTVTTTTTSKADLSSPESSPVLRRKTVETTRTVTVTGGTKKQQRGRNVVSRLWATILEVPRPIMVQILCLLIFFGSFIPLK